MLSNLSEDRTKLNEISSGESSVFSDCEELSQSQQLEESKLQHTKNPLQRDRMTTEDLRVKVEEVQQTIKVYSAEKQAKSNFVKRMVSKQKQRFELDGFDLDLTYITPNLIAMGFPAIDFESVYRNSMEDVKRFFNTRHANCYKIYNLCQERRYPWYHFNNSVAEYPFDDHQPPPFKIIFAFCADVAEWLSLSETNVAGIHCKAGKGRTGLMVCCYLLYSRYFETSLDVQRYFGMIRTKNRQGITIPSQIRYLDYFETALNSELTIKTIPQSGIMITKIILHTLPNFRTLGGCDPWFRVQNGKFEFISPNFGAKKGLQQLELDPEEIIVEGDVLVQFFNNSFKSSKEKMFQFWFHTAFITSPLVLTKAELDSACKDKQHKKFSKNFKIEMHFIQAPVVRRRSKLMYKDEGQMLQKQENTSVDDEPQDDDFWKSFEVVSHVMETNETREQQQ